MCVTISLLLTHRGGVMRPRLNTFRGPVYNVWADRRTGSVLSDGSLLERPRRLMEMLLNEGRRGFKWAVASKELSTFLKMSKRGWMHAGGRTCAFSVYLLLCKHVSVCVRVWVRGGNRWEVCHVLVNKSVIVLFCPAWLTVSCAGSTPVPPNPVALTCMPAHTYLTHTHPHAHKRIQGHTQSCAQKQILLCIGWWPVIELGHHQWYFRFGGPTRPSEEASALLFPAMETFESAAGVRRGPRGWEVHVLPLPAAHRPSLKSVTHGASGHAVL